MDAQIIERIAVLWDELADFDAARADEARNHLLAGVCRLIGARNATWVGAVRLGDPRPDDPVNGWRPRAVHQLHRDPAFERVVRERGAGIDEGRADATTIANVAGAGQYRVNLLSDLVPREWFDGAFYRLFYLDAGFGDAIWAGVPINEDAEAYFGFYRGIDVPRFGEADKEVVGRALRGLRWFHRQQLLSAGVGVASGPLSQSERRVLNGLLLGWSERQIADAHGHSPHTTHEYVKRLFRKYGVSSRSALMALWLGGQAPAGGRD